MVDVPVLGKMILNIFTPQLDDVEICCFEAITVPIVCSKFDILLGNLHKSDNPERPKVFVHLSDRHTHNNEWQI